MPKGWPIKGLTPRKAAAREAFEEAGVRGKIGARPIGRYPYAKLSDDESGAISCEVLVFALEVKRQLKDWPEASEREVRWMDARAAAELIEDEGLRRVVEAFAERKRHETSPSGLKGANRKAAVPAPKVVVTNWVDEDALEPLRRLGANVVSNQGASPGRTVSCAPNWADADVMVAFMPDRVDADLLRRPPA